MIAQQMWLPFAVVFLISALYALFFRYLFPRPVNDRLVVFAVGGNIACLLLGIALFATTRLGSDLTAALLRDVRAIQDLKAALRLALVYAALPEEALKIGIVALLLKVQPARFRDGSDAAQLLLVSAISFALVESCIYVYAVGDEAGLRHSLMTFALLRGALGAMLHSLLAMVAGYFLLFLWPPSSWRWSWLLMAYGVAVALHAAFDGCLLHLIFRSGDLTANGPDVIAPRGLALPAAASAGSVAILIAGGLLALRATLRRAGLGTVASRGWRRAGLLTIGLAVLLFVVPSGLAAKEGSAGHGAFDAALPVALGAILFVIGLMMLMKRKAIMAVPDLH